MGVAITDLLERKEIDIASLRNRTLAIDAHNHLYQYISSIRQRDGALLTDENGNVTSHLVGLLSRTTHLMKAGIKLVYVFDGVPPALKASEIAKRKMIKQEAAAQYESAKEEGDEESMRKYAARTSRLSKDMIAESQKLLQGLGVPYVIAPSEGEAQAAHMTKKGECSAVSSQDADSLLFGSPVVVRNLSVSGKRKMTGKAAYTSVEPESIILKETLDKLGITRKQLVFLSMLVGTDYNPSGIKGIGPKKALQLVKEKQTPEKIFAAADWNTQSEIKWEDILETFETMPVTDEYSVQFNSVDREALIKLLVDEHNFSEDRVDKAVSELAEAAEKRTQKGLFDF